MGSIIIKLNNRRKRKSEVKCVSEFEDFYLFAFDPEMEQRRALKRPFKFKSQKSGPYGEHSLKFQGCFFCGPGVSFSIQVLKLWGCNNTYNHTTKHGIVRVLGSFVDGGFLIVQIPKFFKVLFKKWKFEGLNDNFTPPNLRVAFELFWKLTFFFSFLYS